ncbi:MAG: hypothetical protein ACKVTZ_23390 [Bacteroidia bacterium]
MLKRIIFTLTLLFGVSVFQPSFAGVANKPPVETQMITVKKGHTVSAPKLKAVKEILRTATDPRKPVKNSELDARVNFWVLGGGIASLLGGLMLMISGSMVALILMGLVFSFSAITLLYFLAGGRVPKFLLKGNQDL